MISANASDNVGVAGVQFKVDGAGLGTEISASPYTISWDTTSVPNGTHVLTAVARDAVGNTATSTSVTVTVNNTTQTFTFSPIADAYVRQGGGAAGSNFGTSAVLKADTLVGSTAPDEADAYLKFDVGGLPTGIQSAKLRLYVTNGTGNAPPAILTGTSWDELSVNWNTKPASQGSTVDDKGSVPVDSWLEYDVTSLVTGNGLYSFGLLPQSSDGLEFNSREATSNQPQLVVTTNSATPPSDPLVVAAGDVACPSISGPNGSDTCQHAQTSDLILSMNPDKVLNLGDVQYDSSCLGTINTAGRYNDTWGRFKDKTYVTSGGSHDFYGGDPIPGLDSLNNCAAPNSGQGFRSYFGVQAGPTMYYPYSFDIGAWHVTSLNSYCGTDREKDGTAEVPGCAKGQYQETWLRSDLTAAKAAGSKCQIAMWHEPRWTSYTRQKPQTRVDALAKALSDSGVELLLVGHAHTYERFVPHAWNGSSWVRDDANGLTEIVVGTGGKSLDGDVYAPAGQIFPDISAAHNNKDFGVLEMKLHANSVEYRFVPAAGKPGDSPYKDPADGSYNTIPCH